MGFNFADHLADISAALRLPTKKQSNLNIIGTDRIMVIKIHNSQHQHLYVINVYMPSSNYTVAEYDAMLS